MAWPEPPWAARLGALALLVTVAGCGVFSRRDGVYIEAIPSSGLDAARTVALRVTVFEYGDEAGGFVEFYDIDGVYNTLRSPWVAPSRCRYFGPVPVRDNRFRVVTDAADPTDQLVMELQWNGALRTELRADVEADARSGLADGPPPWTVNFTLDRGRTAERRCGDDLALGADLAASDPRDAGADSDSTADADADSTTDADADSTADADARSGPNAD